MVYVGRTAEAKRQAKEHQALETIVSIDSDDWYDILDYALDGCRNCHECDKELCNLRRILKSYGTPAAQQVTDGCEYQVG